MKGTARFKSRYIQEVSSFVKSLSRPGRSPGKVAKWIVQSNAAAAARAATGSDRLSLRSLVSTPARPIVASRQRTAPRSARAMNQGRSSWPFRVRPAAKTTKPVTAAISGPTARAGRPES